MPAKDMKMFLHEFFNPPKPSKTTEKKKKAGKKKAKKKIGPSPIQCQLGEAAEFMKYKLREFESCTSEVQRLDLVYKTLPHDTTTIDRLWPNQLLNKDSRIRREFSTLGLENLKAGEFDQTLENYNESVLYSSGKGLGHTLARRGGFLLQTRDHNLALRDLYLALEYGCLENEMLDILIEHQLLGIPNDLIVGRQLELKYNRAVLRREENTAVYQIRSILAILAELTNKNSQEAKDQRVGKLLEITGLIKKAAETVDFRKNIETREIRLPSLVQKNAVYHQFSSAVTVEYDAVKGRYLKATREILAGDLLGLEEGAATMLYPEKPDNIVNHCQHCCKFTKAPLPCEVCCSIVYCSVDCRDTSLKSYHKYECEMRVYEIIPEESTEMSPFFLTLRTVTQENLKFFIDRSESFETFFEQTEPIFPLSVGPDSDCAKYMHAMNLVSHKSNLPEEKSMKCSVIAVYLLRCLQHGKYFRHYVPQKKKGDRTLHKHEYLMLRILHHLVFVQLHNALPIQKLIIDGGKLAWETLGLSLNTRLSLINHSCDPNAFVLHVNQHVLLIASTHIRAEEEVTISYCPSFLKIPLDQREYRLLKNYEFQCECRACVEKWALVDEIPDYLSRIPNFEQERCYVVRHGDKKDICDEINGARWMADFGLTTNSFEVAQEALDALCRSLNTHVRKPHIHFVEAAEMVEKFAISKYLGFTLTELAQISQEKEEVKSLLKNNQAQVSNTSNGSSLQHNGFHSNVSPSPSLTNRMFVDAPSIESSYTVDNSSLVPDERISEEPPSMSKLIQTFQEPRSTTESPQFPSRSKSPTLLLFSSPLPGKGRRSVLERFDDSKFKEISNQAVFEVKRAKHELVNSLRRFPARTEMMERRAAFQSDSNKAESRISNPLKEMNLDVKKDASETDVQTQTNQMHEKIDPDSGVDKQLNELKRKRNTVIVSEEVSNELKAFIEKDEKVQKNINFGEEKLIILKEKSLKKDIQLTEKEMELQKLRERTKVMILRAQQKEESFTAAEKEFETLIVKNPKEKMSRMDKILAKANEKANALKEEMKLKRKKEDDDDNLLAFLRKSHKKGANIYSYIDESKSDKDNKVQTDNSEKFAQNLNPNPNIAIESKVPLDNTNRKGICENKYNFDISLAVEKSPKVNMEPFIKEPSLFLDCNESRNKILNENQQSSRLLFIPGTNGDNEAPKPSQYGSRPRIGETLVGSKASSNGVHIAFAAKNGDTQCVNKSSSEELFLTGNIPNGKSDYNRIFNENNFSKNDHLSPISNFLPSSRKNSNEDINKNEDSIFEGFHNDDQHSSQGDLLEIMHYSKRCSVSPNNDDSERPSRSRQWSVHKPPIVINGAAREHNAVMKESRSRDEESPPKYGKLCRRKSLSENCLLSKSNQRRQGREVQDKDLDAFGIPRIPRQKRSVSLMRETFAKRPKENPSNNLERQRSISRETRTCSAAEFKSLFESGTPVNSKRNSRGTTPCKPIQVDSEHLTKIKTKFQEVNTDNLKLPFPNCRPKPPLPRCKPPPPPKV